MSAPAARTVKRLRLTGPGEAEVRRTANRVEDALRVASLRDPAGRLVVIRRVDLPPIETRSATQSVALGMERAVERAMAGAVHGGEPSAAGAPAVWFSDRLEAHVIAGERVVAGERLDAWYWRLAIPALTSRTAPLRALARSLARLEVAPAALPVWIREMGRAGGARALSTLADQLDPQDVVDLRAAVGLGAEVPERSAEPSSGSAVELVARLFAEGQGLGHGIDPGRRVTAGLAPGGVGEEVGGARVGRSRAEDAGYGEPSDAAGILLLLPVLMRLGFGEWARLHPEWDAWDVPARVLGLVADRLGVPDDDPVRTGFPTRPRDPREAPGRWRAPPSVRGLRRAGASIVRVSGGVRYRWDRSGALLLGYDDDPGAGGGVERVPPATRADAVAGAWAVAARRWLRRAGRLGIRGTVRRRGRLTVSPTHIDVTFPLREADVGIRRAGLDIDPGWLPWYRRVIRYHYADRPPEETS